MNYKIVTAFGLCWAMLGMIVCIVAGALLWDVSPTLSKAVGLYGSLFCIGSGMLAFCVGVVMSDRKGLLVRW